MFKALILDSSWKMQASEYKRSIGPVVLKMPWNRWQNAWKLQFLCSKIITSHSTQCYSITFHSSVCNDIPHQSDSTISIMICNRNSNKNVYFVFLLKQCWHEWKQRQPLGFPTELYSATVHPQMSRLATTPVLLKFANFLTRVTLGRCVLNVLFLVVDICSMIFWE